MTQPLPPDQFNHILQLITPYMDHQNRRSYIMLWCASHPNLYGHIDWTGSNRDFATRVIERFHTYGLVDPDKRALDYFLEAVRADMGLEDQAAVDDILAAMAQQETDRRLSLSKAILLPPASLRIPHFTGRDTLLEELKTELQLGQMVALCGPGGIGKTSLAVEAVYRLRDAGQLEKRFPDGVLFHSFYDEQATELALDNLLRQLGEQSQPPLTHQAEQIFKQRQLLLILDGAEDATDLSAMINLRGNCGVLLTSRERKDARGCHHTLDIAPFSAEEAVNLLHQLVNARHCDDDTARAICQLLGDLPLAVQLIGSDMAENGLLGEEVLAWLQQTPLDALDQGQRQHESVPILLARSLERVSDRASQALALIGQLALAPVDHTLLAPALEQELSYMPRMLGELVNLSMLRREEDGRYSVVHALIHTYASEKLMPDTECLTRLGNTYAEFAERQSELGLAGYARLDPERVHLLAVAEACTDAEAWSIVDQLAWVAHEYLHDQGHWIQRIDLLQMGIQSAQALSNRWNEGAHLGHLGLAYCNLGQMAKAIDYYEYALTIVREIGYRRGEGNHLGNLGGAYSALGLVMKAIEYYERALAIAREIGDYRNEEVWMGNLGLAYNELGRVAEAINYYEQALTIAGKIGDRRGEGIQLGNLGLAYRELGLVTKAVDYYEYALTIAREIGDRSFEGICLGNLGEANADMTNAMQAISLCKQSLKIHQDIGYRKGEGCALNLLGYSYSAGQQWRKAIEFYLKAIALQKEFQDRYQLGRTWHNLGQAYIATDQLVEAEAAFAQALALAQEVGDRWGETQCQWQWGLLYEQQGQAAEAVAAMQVCVDYFAEIGHVETEERAAYLERVKGLTSQER